ncbi:hypothetical protein [Streptoalloteichus hindustanus]|uniref:Uncharacterized protein n=1 Tax=Streptoalloteichus hindustanus TaxID=2017 RepID=A0A1M5MWV1_STRHI|nr:hypothetical protein [Streptoalloteichus hindustanus]SHG81794.1 hypothetical protein SAMN05444320_11484 [Streptoalloteichus hindustanus]
MQKAPRLSKLVLVTAAVVAAGLSSASVAGAAPGTGSTSTAGSAAQRIAESPGPVPASLGAFDGLWAMALSNGFVVRLDLSASGPDGGFTGIADYAGASGTVTGRLNGNDVVFDIKWKDGRVGRCWGHLSADGREWSGDSVDLTTPGSEAKWWARRV